MSSFGVRVYKDYFNFSSSHFLIFADGAREELHGHNYHVRVRLHGAIGPDDMVLDFGKIKPIVRMYCKELDHRTLLPNKNGRLQLSEAEGHVEARYTRPDGGIDRFLFPARDVVRLPINNTSTERLAEFLASKIVEHLRGEEAAARLTRLEIEVEESGGQCGCYATDLG